MPALPLIIAPVGKSGPGIICINSSISISLFSIKAKHPSIISLRLCGGIFVAIPTAIPDEPLTSRLGTFVGSVCGIDSVSS